MMGEIAKIQIDGDALRNEVLKKFTTMESASIVLGYSKSFFSCSISRGRITKRAANAIESTLGIPLSKYELSPERQVTVDELVPQSVSSNFDGGMVRNINVEFVKFRAKELGIPLKSFCDVMGKNDNYMYNLKTNGAKLSDFERMCMILQVKPDDKSLFVEPVPIEQADEETVENLRTKLHKAESQIADLRGQIRMLKEQSEEQSRRLEGIDRLHSRIIGTLHKNGIYVGKNQ